MLVGRLFERLFERGVVVVTTSNRAPDELYKDGLNRQLFLPFIALIKERLEVHELASATDHRLDRLAGAPVYHAPLGAGGDRGARRRLGPAGPRPGVAADAARPRARRDPAAVPQRGGAGVVRGALRPAARAGRLSGDRRGGRRADPRRRAGAVAGAQQRGQAVRDADRRALRGQGPADRLRRRRARGALSRGRRAPSSSSAPPRGCTRCRRPTGGTASREKPTGAFTPASPPSGKQAGARGSGAEEATRWSSSHPLPPTSRCLLLRSPRSGTAAASFPLFDWLRFVLASVVALGHGGVHRLGVFGLSRGAGVPRAQRLADRRHPAGDRRASGCRGSSSTARRGSGSPTPSRSCCSTGCSALRDPVDAALARVPRL